MSEKLNKPWMLTYSGKSFTPLDPKIEDICIEDIAHGLSNLCRYGGQCLEFYSVSEHSVLMCDAVSEPNKLWALLHDASEAYLVDVPRPIKRHLGGYIEAEARLMALIRVKFGLEGEMPDEVEEADTRILMDERIQNMSESTMPWSTDGTPLGVTLLNLTPYEAEQDFLNRYYNIMDGK